MNVVLSCKNVIKTKIHEIVLHMEPKFEVRYKRPVRQAGEGMSENGYMAEEES